MPMVRYQIRNVYGLADPEVYRAADKDDPEALLEGVEMAGLVGVLRQLGDLAEFAAEVFHDLHEEVMSTSSRGNGLMLRLQQLESEFPSIEKVILSETDHSHCAFSAGIDWHANLRVQQNLVIQGDMPRFILDSYEECRGTPRLFMLDKFDVAGAGACLTRYSNPSFFKIESASTAMMEAEMQREKRPRKPNKKGSYMRNGETTESFFTPIIDHSQFTASEPVPEKFPARFVKLKHRKLRVSDISSRKSYMDGFLKKESFEENDPKSSSSSCHNNKSMDWSPEVQEVLIGGVTDPLLVRKEVAPLSPKEEVTGRMQNQKREAGEFLETVSISSCVSQKIYPNSQNAKEVVLVGLGNETGIHDYDVSSDEIDTNLPLLEQAVQTNLLADAGFITDDDHDSYMSDDIGSDLENYVDAMNAMESELETDSENRAKSDPNLFSLESQGTNPNINEHIEPQPRSSGSGFSGSFDTSKASEKVKDGMPSLSQSTILVDLTIQQLQRRTVFEETSSEVNQGETVMLERTSESMELVPSACFTSNETCYQKQPNATMVPISREAFTSSCIADSTLNSKPNFEEAQSLAASEAVSGSTKSTPEVDENVESSFLPWQTNYVVVFPTCKEHPDVPTDILEEMNTIEHSQDRISATITDKDYMPCDSSETEHGILPEKAPAECFKESPLTLMDDEIGKLLEMSEPDKNDCTSETSSTIPMDSTVLEYLDTSNDLEIDMQSEDLSVQISPNYTEGGDGESKQLNSSVLFPAETHKLTLVVSDDSRSYGSTQTSENVDDDLAYIPDESGSPHGSQNNSVIGQLSGYTEKKKSDDMAGTFGMPEPPQIQADSSLLEVSSVYVKDSLQDSVEDNETYSVEKLSPKSSAFSLEIVSSIPHSESLAAEIRNISVSREEFVHPQSPSSSENVDILGCNGSISAAIPFVHPQEPDNGGMLEPLPSGCRDGSDANQLQHEVSELVETNGKEHVNDGLQFSNGSTKFGVHNDPLLLVESKLDNSSLSGNAITKEGINGQVLNMLESAEVTTFDELLQEKPLLEDDTLHQPEPDIEEPAIRHSTSLQSENKSFLSFTRNEELEMLNSVSRCQSSALDLSNSSEAKLVDVKGDNNEQDSDSKSENTITEDDTYGEVLSLLLSSNISNFDVQIQEDPISEDAALNLQRPVIEEFDSTNSDSKFNSISQVGTDGQILPLVESSNLYSFDVQIQEDPVSEDASLNQHKPEIEEPAITSDLTSLRFESKFFVPLYENRDQKSVNIVSSSQLLALDLSNFIDAKLASHDFDDIHMEESLIYSREDEQDSDSDAAMQHYQADAERPEVQFEQVSISQAVEPSTSPLYRDVGNMEPSYIHLDEVCSDEPTIIQLNVEHERLLTEPDSETFLGHESNNELSMPVSKAHENEQETNVYVPLQGVSEHPVSSMASKALPSASPAVADFMIPIPITSTQEHLQALPGETISSLPLQEGIKETPPLPPLPPMQWRMSKPQLGSLIAGGHIAQPMMETNPLIFPSNIDSMHINPLPASKEKLDQHTNPFVSPATFEEGFQHVSSCTDGQMTEYLKLSEFPEISLDQRQHLEIHSSGLSLIVSSKEDGKDSHGNNITMGEENPFTVAPSLKDAIPRHSDVLEAGTPQAIEECRPKLVKLLPGLELERSQEAPIIDAIPSLSSFMFMPTMGDGMYPYAYGDYEGENMQYHNLSAPFPVAGHSASQYGYHMFIRNGNSSTIYDIMLPEMEGDKPNGEHRSIRNRPRDPLIEAVAAHDKSTLRKVSELNPQLTKQKEDERNYLLEQIKNKSSSLKPATSAKGNLLKAPSTNLKVAAILEKANAIRQACVGSDEDDDDNWNGS